jgi:hypothetical protein
VDLAVTGNIQAILALPATSRTALVTVEPCCGQLLGSNLMQQAFDCCCNMRATVSWDLFGGFQSFLAHRSAALLPFFPLQATSAGAAVTW